MLNTLTGHNLVLQDELGVNDTLVGQALVVIYEDSGCGAKAHARSDHTFTAVSLETTAVLLDENGNKWQVTENALINEADQELPRPYGLLVWLIQLLFPHNSE